MINWNFSYKLLVKTLEIIDLLVVNDPYTFGRKICLILVSYSFNVLSKSTSFFNKSFLEYEWVLPVVFKNSHFPRFTCTGVCFVLRNLTTHEHSCAHHHGQDTGWFRPQKDPPWCPHFFFLPYPWHMEFPRTRMESSLSGDLRHSCLR